MRSWLCALLCIAGCSRASEESETKRSPRLPPPPEAAVPVGLAIEVTVDGTAAAPLTAARLDQTKPDFVDEERRAWKLASLLPVLAAPGATIEARGTSGLSLRVEHKPDGPEPVLFLTRRGEVMVSLVDPSEPFPSYHGQGGQLGRQGDPLPRITSVTSLVVTTR